MNITERRSNLSTWFFNPFTFWGGSKIMWLGLLVIAVHIPIGYFLDARFDGALDMHISTVDSIWQPFIDVVIAWPAMFLSLYLLALCFKSPVRLIDIAGATAVARIPLLISVLPAKVSDPGTRDVSELLSLQGMDLWMLMTGALIILLFFVWFIVLLFNAYKINSALKGWKLITSFIIGVLIAEVISKFALIYL